MLARMDLDRIRAALSRTPRLGARGLHALLEACEGDMSRALVPESLDRACLSPAARAYLDAPDEAACRADADWLRASGARLVLHGEPDYPAQLLALASPPVGLFILGDPLVLQSSQVAIIGSRNPTSGGRDTARNFAADLARAGLTITSGLAVGIDAASHEGALLAGGMTIAVCGTGLDQVYPRAHAGLARRIREHGALVSQFPPRTCLRRGNFPCRNRLISGLARGVLVVEASLRSGSLATAQLAARQGRRVLAVPGSVRNPLARGCHWLIRAGAELVEDPSQVLSAFNLSLSNEGLAGGSRPVGIGRVLDNEYEMLLDALAFEPATIDLLAERTGRSCESVASMLLILELEGRVAPQPGGRYGPLS